MATTKLVRFALPLLAVVSIEAGAASISQTLQFSDVTVTDNLTSASSTSLGFTRFDPSLGTLNSVTWSFTGAASFGIRMRGGPLVLDPESGESVETNGSFWWLGSNVRLLDAVGAQVDSRDLAFASVFRSLAPNATTADYPGFEYPRSEGFSGTVTWPAAGNLAQFVGLSPGSLAVNASSSQLQISCGIYCPPELAGRSKLDFSSTLVFDYTPVVVPVPAAGWLFISALGAAGVLRRLRN